jgi:hypothetical protein
MSVQLHRIKHDLDTLGCSADNFCSLADIATSKWSRALRGLVVLPGPEIIRLSNLVQTLREIAAKASPLPIDFRDLPAVKVLVQHHENGIHWTPTANAAETQQQHD